MRPTQITARALTAGVALLAAAALSACASAPPRAEDLIREMAPKKFVTPTPSHLFPGAVDLALAPGDRIIAECDAYFSDRLPDMDANQRAEFRNNVICVYPAPGRLQASASHYRRQLAAKGFKEKSGTFVQSGMNIFYSPSGGSYVSFRVEAKFIPRALFCEKDGKPTEVEGGGRLAHETLMFAFHFVDA